MKNKMLITSTIFGLILVLGGSNANAIPISIDQTLNASVTSGSPYNGSFDLTANGFTPGSQTISFAYASFSILDLDRNSDFVTIALDGSVFASGPSNPFGFSAFGGAVTGTVLADTSSSGVLDYTVSVLFGNSGFTLKGASLLADVTQNAPVPDGGSTAALLGCAMLGLGWARKKLIA